MKNIVFVLFLSISLFANIFDDYNIINAQKSYEQKDYEKALIYLNKIKKQDSKVFYNRGNTLYKLKRYEDAINEYLKVLDVNLMHSVNHNIANAYLNLKNENEEENIENLNKAIEFYNKALVYKDDEKTVYNLEMTIQKQKLLNERQIRDLNENVCEIQRKGLIEELTRNTLFDFYEIDEKIKLFEDKQTGLGTLNENSKITKDDKNREIYIDDKLRVKEELGKKVFKMNSYFDEKYDNVTEIKDAKTLVVPMQKGIVDDEKKAW